MCLRPEYEPTPNVEYPMYQGGQEAHSEIDCNEWNELANMLQDDMGLELLDQVTPMELDTTKSTASEQRSVMAIAASTCKPRAIQFCSVCCGVRRHGGRFVNDHTSSSFCPIKNRYATQEDKRELRRIRQKIRRKVSKSNSDPWVLPEGLPSVVAVC